MKSDEKHFDLSEKSLMLVKKGFTDTKKVGFFQIMFMNKNALFMQNWNRYFIELKGVVLLFLSHIFLKNKFYRDKTPTLKIENKKISCIFLFQI